MLRIITVGIPMMKFLVVMLLSILTMLSHGEGVNSFGITFSPSGRNEYIFIGIPTNSICTEAGEFLSDSDSYPQMRSGKRVGEIRKIKFTGNPFSQKQLRHEDLAWMYEAIYERQETSVPGRKMWGPNESLLTNIPVSLSYSTLSFTNREIFKVGSWTNNFITSHPHDGEMLFDVNNVGYPYQEELYRAFNADLTPVDLFYTNTVKKHAPIRKSDYKKLYDALTSHSTWIRTPWLHSQSPLVDMKVYDCTYKGTDYTFTLVNNEYVPSSQDVDTTESYDTVSYGVMSWDFSGFKQIITYSSGWQNSDGNQPGHYTSTRDTGIFTYSEFSSMDFPSSDDDESDSEFFVSTGCHTNIVNIGNFNRLKNSGKIIITFDVSQYKAQDNEEVEDSEWVVAICESIGSFVVAGSEGYEFLVDDDLFDEGEIVAVSSSGIKSLFMRAAEKAGITWKEEYMPILDPVTYSLGDLGDIYSPHRLSSTTTSRISQRVDMSTAYVTLDMDFKMK